MGFAGGILGEVMAAVRQLSDLGLASGGEGQAGADGEGVGGGAAEGEGEVV